MEGGLCVLQVNPGQLYNLFHAVVHRVAVDEQLGGGLRQAVVAEQEGVQRVQQAGAVGPVIGGQDEEGGVTEIHDVIVLLVQVQGVIDREFVVKEQALLAVEQLPHLQRLDGLHIAAGQVGTESRYSG